MVRRTAEGSKNELIFRKLFENPSISDLYTLENSFPIASTIIGDEMDLI